MPLASGNQGWRLDLDAVFAACDERTRAIYYASPGNPTGWVLERDEVERLLAFCRERGIAILADEVYHRLVYDRPVAPSILEVATPEDRVYSLNSFSKAWAMTGWRLGWVVYPAGQKDEFEKLIQFNTSGAPGFLQDGAVAALRDGEDFVRFFVERCREGRDIVTERLAEDAARALTPSDGSSTSCSASRASPTRSQFCKRCVQEAGVGLAPGIGVRRRRGDSRSASATRRAARTSSRRWTGSSASSPPIGRAERWRRASCWFRPTPNSSPSRATWRRAVSSS